MQYFPYDGMTIPSDNPMMKRRRNINVPEPCEVCSHEQTVYSFSSGICVLSVKGYYILAILIMWMSDANRPNHLFATKRIRRAGWR